MGLKHKVCINVTDQSGQKQTVLRGGVRTMPTRLLKFLLGENAEVLVPTPGQSVASVEIHEIKEVVKHEQNEIVT